MKEILSDSIIYLDAIYEIESYLHEIEESDFENNNMIQSACIRQLEIIGEAANKISETMKMANPSIEWRELIGLRNILIHEYFGVDLSIIWQIIKFDLPELKDKIKSIQ